MRSCLLESSTQADEIKWLPEEDVDLDSTHRGGKTRGTPPLEKELQATKACEKGLPPWKGLLIDYLTPSGRPEIAYTLY